MSNDPQIQHTSNRSGRAPVPWLWLGLGILAAAIALFALTALLTNFLVEPPEESSMVLEPSIIQLTAPPIPTTTLSTNPPTPTIAPTATTAPTPDVSIAPAEVTIGHYAQVVETGGVGVTVRNGPSTANLPVVVAAEGSILLITDGPTPGGDYQWWQVRLTDGTEGWVAGDFLVPSAAP